MERRNNHIGPGAASVLLIVVVLSMSALGMLAMMNARSDLQLGLRSAGVAERTYALTTRAEETLAALDETLAQTAREASDDAAWLTMVGAALPENMTMEDRTIRWTEDDGEGRSLVCAVTLNPLGGGERLRWTEQRLVTELDEELPEEEGWTIWF